MAVTPWREVVPGKSPFVELFVLAAVLFMFVWSLILCAYIAYRRKRPQLHAASAFKMPGGVVMCYVCLAFFAFVLALLTLQADTRQALLASPVWFLLLGIGYALKRRGGARA
jgi:D-serine/D-alanine/glycine transporter